MDLPIYLTTPLTLVAILLAAIIGIVAYRQPIALAFAMWRHKRRWPLSAQVYHLRVALQADNRWMHHDRTARELTDRYLAMLADDWMSISHEDTSQLRRRLNLNPVVIDSEDRVHEAVRMLLTAGATNIRFDYPEPLSVTKATVTEATETEATSFPTSFSVLVADAQRRASAAKSNNENEETTS